ncbi:Ferric/cupric reductase transmembrane component 2 [Fusarium oxysporum f. sp. raphani]|uniref:Ferric/cupric reductase transmembrane component 2 n=1 Tax=Fusarium oxysporum f. sp. raphani TaxID=96318 RepID=A0A8J5PBQ4_FUSOX|nr:Ferric/cupric reductase transmembrane component 2 [Fusarium oxysporum f. sp. raphani]
MRHVAYPLFLRRRRAWDSITRLQACLIFFFFAANLVVIFAPFNGVDWRQIERRTAFTAGVNAIPLCLGGRMGPVVQMLNIHRTSYLLFHRWVGRIAVLEAVSHAIIVLLHRPKTGTLVTSGWVAFAGFLGSLVLSFWLPRHFLGRWFLLSHRAIALTGVGALFWHALAVSQIRSQILVGICCTIWLLSTFYRLQKLLFRRLSGEVVEKLVGRNATRLDISLRYPVHIEPGSYFNIFFPGRISSYNLLYSHQAVAFWHPPDDVDPEGKSSNVSFLLSHCTANVAALSVLQTGQRILLDGPFGQRLEPHSYENVILLAKGMGIAGILPLALGLAERRQHDNRIRAELQRLTQRSQSLLREEGSADLDDRATIARERAEVAKQRIALSRKPLFRDATKKIDLFWSLESNSQMDLVADQLRSLQQLDPDNSFLVVWCGYPYPRTGEAPFQPISTFWMCLEPSPQRKAFDELIIGKIGEERKKLQGPCGNGDFTSRVREGTIRSIEDMSITFVETEYRPAGIETVPINEAFGHELLRERERRKRKQRTSQDTEMRNLTDRVSYASAYSEEFSTVRL